MDRGRAALPTKAGPGLDSEQRLPSRRASRRAGRRRREGVQTLRDGLAKLALRRRGVSRCGRLAVPTGANADDDGEIAENLQRSCGSRLRT